MFRCHRSGMGLLSRLWRRAPAEFDRLREELRLTRAQQEADRTRFEIREQQLTRLVARFNPPAPAAGPDPLRDEIALRENWPGWFTGQSQFGSIISPLAGLYDGITPLGAAVPTLWDYTLNLGFYVTEAWLDILRMYARVWYATTPQAQGVMRGLRDYIVHTGFEYQVQPKEGVRCRQSLPDEAQRIVDDFLTANQWFETEQDWFLRLHREGEVFPCLYPSDDGVTRVRTIEPWQVRGENTTPENTFGVLTARGDRETVEGYRVTMSGNGTDAEVIGPGRMSMIKINSDKQVKRGVSDFVAVGALFGSLTTLLQNTQVGESLRQALVWVQETTGAANPLVEMGPSGTTAAPGYTFSGPGSWGPGQIPTMDKNLQFKPGPVGNAQNAQLALQVAYQALSVYFRVPEWMISGTSAANFASSLTQESPLVRMAQAEQKFLKDKYGAVVTMALKIAEEQDLLEPGSVDRLELNIEATPLVVREPAQETSRNKTLNDAGIISKRTWSTREDLDRDHELENLKEEKADPAQQTQQPGGAPPGQPGAPAPDARGQPAPEPPPPPSSTPSAEYGRLAPRPDGGAGGSDNPLAGLMESYDDEDEDDPDPDEIDLREADLSHPVGTPYKSATGKSWLVNKDVGGGKIKAVRTADPSRVKAAADSKQKKTDEAAKKKAARDRAIEQKARASQEAARAKLKARAEANTLALKAANGTGLTSEELETLSGHLSKLTVAEITDIQKAFAAKAGGRLKIDRIKKVLAWARGPEELTRDRGRGNEGVRGTDAGASRPVAGATGGPGVPGAGGRRQGDGEPAGTPDAARVPAATEEAVRRIDRFEKLFRGKGQEQVADWLLKLKEHVAAVGGEAALAALGPEAPAGAAAPTQYEGASGISDFTARYLDRVGIALVADQWGDSEGGEVDPSKPVISSAARSRQGFQRPTTRRGKPKGALPGDFLPRDPTLANKLAEAKALPGLESSEDIGTIAGHHVTHLTPDVTAKLDAKYGPGQWIVKAYGHEAAAGYGIFFPQRSAAIAQDARNTLWSAGEEVAKHGFELARERPGGGLPHALKAFEGLELAAPEGKDFDDRWQQPEHVRAEHNKDVLEAAEKSGLMLDPERVKQLTGSHNVGGLEHDVHEDQQNGRFVKLTKGGHFGQSKDLPEYLGRLAVANRLWPQSGHKFEGITKDAEGRPQAVTSMNRIEGSEPSQDEIHSWFESHGFEPHEGRSVDENDNDLGQQSWIDRWTGTIVGDAHPGNFRKRPDGSLVPIDVDIVPGEGELGRIARTDGPEQVVGLKHHGGATYRFGSDRYDSTIHGDVRQWGDRAAAAAPNEHGAELPGGGQEFMAQPAFAAAGVSDADRAAGKTIAPGEGRVHIVTRNGKAEVVPHATWIKGAPLPVVFEDEGTKAMAQAAADAINNMPESERQGQIYAPDIIKASDGSYKVVEANPSNITGASGYLGDNPLVIDAYVSHLTGREPAHVKFIRQLLSKKAKPEAAPKEGGT